MAFNLKPKTGKCQDLCEKFLRFIDRLFYKGYN